MGRHSDDVARAAEMLRQGVPQKDVAEAVGVTPRQLQRWARDPRYQHLFVHHEPGSAEHRKAILTEALERGNLAERLRAVELLERLGANDKPQGTQRITVHVHGLTHCPACGAHLEPESTVVERGNES